MMFILLLGVLIGGSAVLLIQQWRDASLVTVPSRSRELSYLSKVRVQTFNGSMLGNARSTYTDIAVGRGR